MARGIHLAGCTLDSSLPESKRTTQSILMRKEALSACPTIHSKAFGHNAVYFSRARRKYRLIQNVRDTKTISEKDINEKSKLFYYD